MGLFLSLTGRLVRSELQRASATGADAAPQGTEEERLLATLEPELAAKVQARLAEVGWDTSRSVAPPS
ncbi:MAG: hypothetical protein ACYDHH_20050 [Solirubrobacteraceae bacterium]